MTASVPKPQNQISFKECTGRLPSKQKEKPNMTLDLRHPRLVHLYSSEENGTIAHNKLNGSGDTPGPSSTAVSSSPSGISRPQTARRGGRFCGSPNVHGRSRSDIISDVRESIADSGYLQLHSGPQSLSILEPYRNPASCAASHERSELGVNLESTRNHISNQVSCSIGHTDVIDVTALAQSDPNDPILSMLGTDNTDLDVSNKPSTIIHLKLVSPLSGKEESEAFVVTTQSKSCEKNETCSVAPSGIQEENLDSRQLDCLSKDSMSFEKPDPMPDQNFDGRATKRKLGDASDSDCSNDSDDLPLIVHCTKRSKKTASESLKDGRPAHEVKRTYERGVTAQHGSGSAAGRADDPKKAVEKRGIVYEKSNGGDTVAAGSGGEGTEMSNELWKQPVRPRHLGGSSAWQRQLEEYERNSYAVRSATNGKTGSGRKIRVPGKSPSDGESPRNSKRPASQVKKALPVTSTKKARVLRCLRPGPVSLKRKQMKEFGVNPKMISQVLKELTERRSPVGRTSMSFTCNSHQNYYDGSLVFRLTESLPAKEKVMVHVPVESRDDLDPVGKETITLWRMSDSEVEELQKQVKQEMEHKRTEHIMPVVLQMSYEQIETAYEQVKKDMKTYEITEKDSDVEEEDDEEDNQKDEEVEDESMDNGEGEEREKDNRHEESAAKVEELENDTDENLHVRSYDIIVHDESSKTISCETVKYLEWRKKHPSFDNGESEVLGKEVENPVVFEAGVENDPPLDSPNAVTHTDTSVEQTNYSRNRPKRHAVDYSPNAFAPIRLMEGKRLGGKTAPAKLQAKKKTVNDVSQGRMSLTSACDTSHGGNVNCDLTGSQKNHKNTPSGEVGKNKSSAKRRSGGRKKLPNSPQRELATTSPDVASVNALNAISPNCEPLARGDNHIADVESDDEVPVILDVSDMPLCPAGSLPATPEQIPVLCEHNSYLEKHPPSAYDAVRNEYIRLRDLTRSGAADNSVMLSDVTVSGVCDVEKCSSNEKPHREETGHVPPLSDEFFVEKQNPSRESSDLSQTHLEAFAPTQNATNGRCLVNMPSLQHHCGDILGTEELVAPPDLGLPIECLNSQQQQHPGSPILPPVLQVEAGETSDGGDVAAGRHSFPLLMSSSESVGVGGDAAAMFDPIRGDVH